MKDLLVYTQKILQLSEDDTLDKVHDDRLSNILSHAGKSNTINVRIILNKDYLMFAYAFSNMDDKTGDAEKFLNSVRIP